MFSASSEARDRNAPTNAHQIRLQTSRIRQEHRPIRYQLPARLSFRQGQPAAQSRRSTRRSLRAQLHAGHLHRRHRHLLALIDESWCGSCLPQLRGLAEPSSGLPVGQHPGTDLGFQHLADFGARKVIPDFNLLGRFDAPDPLLHEGRYRGDIDGASCSRLHHSDNAFAPLLVWQADDGTILNCNTLWQLDGK